MIFSFPSYRKVGQWFLNLFVSFLFSHVSRWTIIQFSTWFSTLHSIFIQISTLNWAPSKFLFSFFWVKNSWTRFYLELKRAHLLAHFHIECSLKRFSVISFAAFPCLSSIVHQWMKPQYLIRSCEFFLLFIICVCFGVCRCIEWSWPDLFIRFCVTISMLTLMNMVVSLLLHILHLKYFFKMKFLRYFARFSAVQRMSLRNTFKIFSSVQS